MLVCLYTVYSLLAVDFIVRVPLLLVLVARFLVLCWAFYFEEARKFVPEFPNAYFVWIWGLFFRPNPFYSDSFLDIFLSVASLSLNWEESLGWLSVPEVALTWSLKLLGGGQASVLLGIVLGMGSEVIKGSCIISSRVGLFEGSSTKILWIRFLALSEIVMCSGKVYWQALIFL